MKYYWLIKTIDNEYSSSYKYIADTLEEAEEQRMNFCGWYCQRGDVDIIKVDQNFREVETIHYWQGKVWEHRVRVFNPDGVYIDDKYIIKNGKKVN